MKMYVSSYNNGTSSWNNVDVDGKPTAEETAFIDYKLTHQFNEPAEATITLSDPTGTIAQKYNVDANDVYIGPGKVIIEDPTGTDIFYGRILRAEANTATRTVTLYCQDWLSQLDEQQITYDMRENIDGSGLRESQIKSDVGDETKPVSQTMLAYATAGDGAVYTDETDEANDDTANDMTLLPAAPAVNDAYYFGFSDVEDQIQVYISTAGVGTWTITWEVYSCELEGAGCGASDWHALADVTDGTTGFTVAGLSTVSWTAPAKDSYWFSCDPIGEGAAYWIRARVSAYTSITTQPLGQQAWIPQILYDDDMAWDADEWNGYYLMFPNKVAGDITILTGPYAHNVDLGADNAGGYDDLWVDDTNFHDTSSGDASTEVTYDFHINVEDGSMYSSGPTGGRIYLSYVAYNDTTARPFQIEVYKADETSKIIYETVLPTAVTSIRKDTITIPPQYLPDLYDADGEISIQLRATGAVGEDTYLHVYYLMLEMDYVIEGTSEAYLITDTVATNEIHTQANLTRKGLGLYEGAEYCICREVWKHLDSDTGTLITDGDTMVVLTCSATIEATSAVTARQYIDSTRLAIIRDLAVQDNAVFWLPLATTTVYYKKTFNDGTADETLSDTDVNAWHATYDYQKLVNKATVYGMRIGDEEIEESYTNATSTAKYKQTRTKVSRDAGVTSTHDALARATSIVDKYDDVQWLLTAKIRGNTATAAHPKTIVLGDEIQITSTYLGLTNAWYIVQKYEYDTRTHETTLLLHPRQTGLQTEEQVSFEGLINTSRRGGIYRYIPDPRRNIVT